MKKTIYKEFKTGQEIADYYNADNIIQIVKIDGGFGVFSKEPNFSDIELRLSLPSTAYYNRMPRGLENGFTIDLTQKFCTDEIDAVYEAAKIIVVAHFGQYDINKIELVGNKIICSKSLNNKLF